VHCGFYSKNKNKPASSPQIATTLNLYNIFRLAGRFDKLFHHMVQGNSSNTAPGNSYKGVKSYQPVLAVE